MKAAEAPLLTNHFSRSYTGEEWLPDEKASCWKVGCQPLKESFLIVWTFTLSAILYEAVFEIRGEGLDISKTEDYLLYCCLLPGLADASTSFTIFLLNAGFKSQSRTSFKQQIFQAAKLLPISIVISALWQPQVDLGRYLGSLITNISWPIQLLAGLTVFSSNFILYKLLNWFDSSNSPPPITAASAETGFFLCDAFALSNSPQGDRNLSWTMVLTLTGAITGESVRRAVEWKKENQSEERKTETTSDNIAPEKSQSRTRYSFMSETEKNVREDSRRKQASEVLSSKGIEEEEDSTQDGRAATASSNCCLIS